MLLRLFGTLLPLKRPLILDSLAHIGIRYAERQRVIRISYVPHDTLLHPCEVMDIAAQFADLITQHGKQCYERDNANRGQRQAENRRSL